MKHKFKLTLTANGLGSAVELDGNPLPNVRDIQISCGVDKATTVTVEFSHVDVDIDAEGYLRASVIGKREE